MSKTDFINDVGTHSAGVLAKHGRETMHGSSAYDQLKTAVEDWLTEAEITLDLDVTRGMLAALSLVLTRSDVYMKVEHAGFRPMMAEIAATIVEIYEHPRPDMSALDFGPEA